MTGAESAEFEYRGSITHSKPYAAWKLPRSEKISFISASKVRRCKNPSSLLELEEAFVLCPFESDASQTYYIGPELGEDDQEMLPSKPGTRETSKDEFTEMVTNAKARIKSGTISKLVLSRRKNLALPKDQDLFKLFTKLSEEFPDAFVSLVSIPGAGTWIGATPELLLDYIDGTFQTYSLAGTSYPGSQGLGIKESHEQGIVSEFIQQSYNQCGLETTTENSTTESGHLTHLLTKFKAAGSFDKVPELLDLLHPTPAVGGFPRTESMILIPGMEKQVRSLYAGFIGPYRYGNILSLYVNLRCVWINGENATLFAGCGITEDSDPSSEWDETEEKMKVLGKYCAG